MPFPAPSYKTLKVSKPSCAVQAQEAEEGISENSEVTGDAVKGVVLLSQS